MKRIYFSLVYTILNILQLKQVMFCIFSIGIDTTALHVLLIICRQMMSTIFLELFFSIWSLESSTVS